MSETPAEFDAIKTIHGVLAPLEDAAKSRVIGYIVSLLGIELGGRSAMAKGTHKPSNSTNAGGDDGAPGNVDDLANFAELYSAAKPSSNGEKALVAGYWLQVKEGGEGFTAQAANKELNNLGHKVSNITDALEVMKNQAPQLVLQLKKSGSSRQARKLYKVSQAGIERVKAMLAE